MVSRGGRQVQAGRGGRPSAGALLVVEWEGEKQRGCVHVRECVCERESLLTITSHYIYIISFPPQFPPIAQTPCVLLSRSPGCLPHRLLLMLLLVRGAAREDQAAGRGARSRGEGGGGAACTPEMGWKGRDGGLCSNRCTAALSCSVPYSFLLTSRHHTLAPSPPELATAATAAAAAAAGPVPMRAEAPIMLAPVCVCVCV